MSHEIEGIEISAGALTIPELGIWHLRATLTGDAAPDVGAAVTGTIGDLAVAGTVLDRSVYVGIATVWIVGGAGGWVRDVRARSYRASNGVRLSTVLKDLALDTGETIEQLGADARRGFSWTRPAGLGARAADDTRIPWWVGLDGIARFGARPTVTATAEKIGVKEYDGARRSAVLLVPDEVYTPFLPGTVVSGEAFPAAQIRTLTVAIAPSTVSLEVMWIGP